MRPWVNFHNIMLLLKLLDVYVSSMLIAFFSCTFFSRTLFQSLAFQSTLTFKDLNAISIVVCSIPGLLLFFIIIKFFFFLYSYILSLTVNACALLAILICL